MTSRPWLPVTYDAVCAIIQGRALPYSFTNLDGHNVSFEELNSEERIEGYLLLYGDKAYTCEVWRIWWEESFYRYERLI